MFIVISPSPDCSAEKLPLNRRIFARPTPWRIFFQILAHVPFNGRYSPLRCAFLPDDVAVNMPAYEFFREGNMLFYSPKHGTREEQQPAQIFPFLNRLFLVGVFESFVTLGTNYRPWEWRWNPGTFNKRELMQMLLQTDEYRQHAERLQKLQKTVSEIIELLPS